MGEKSEDEAVLSEGHLGDFLNLVDVTTPVPKTELILGTLVHLETGTGFGVTFPGVATPIPCLSTIPLNEDMVQRQVALMFLEGSAAKPVILGLIHEPLNPASQALEVSVDQERLQIVGKKEIELRCGKASILLKANGKIVIKGTHLISRSSGANKIKGASVSLN